MSTTLFHSRGPRLDVALSAGPWTPSETPFRSAAVLIQDADGEIIGWATDAAGHTTESVAPDRRHPAQIMRNAETMALAHELLNCVRAAARLEAGDIMDFASVLAVGVHARALLRRLGER